MLSEKDTIVACSSPPGRGAISVIRLSGDKAFSIIQKITKNKLKKQIDFMKKNNFSFTYTNYETFGKKMRKTHRKKNQQ